MVSSRVNRAFSLVVLILLVCENAHAQDTSWIPIPTDQLDLSGFWNQFWAIVNWLEPLVLPLVGLGLATIVVARLVKYGLTKAD